MKSGSLVRIRDVSRQHYVDLLIEIRGDGICSFAYSHSPYKRLSISQNGSITIKESSTDKSCLIYHECLNTTQNLYSLKSCYVNYYLCFDSTGRLSTKCIARPIEFDVSLNLFINVISDRSFPSSLLNNDRAVPLLTNNNMNNCPLRKWEIQRFINEGYLHLSGTVSSETVLSCCKWLNHTLGNPCAIIPG